MEKIIDSIDFKIIWYDVSDELLFENEDFKKYIDEKKSEIRDNSEGYEKK